MVAARYLGVAPWDLAEQPRVWMDWALMARAAEAKAERGDRNHGPDGRLLPPTMLRNRAPAALGR
jgi:hypothetical protein